MAQYTIITTTTPLNINDGVSYFRYIPVSGDLALRQTKTVTGFSGVEGTDWDDIENKTDLGGGVWRVGVRNLHWVIDCTITATGFSGNEDTDWGNIEQHKLP